MSRETKIYLDYNAATPLRPAALDAVQKACQIVGNPSSPHFFGRAARGLIEGARTTTAAALNVKHAQVTFTSGGTEANNMVLRGFKALGAKVFLSAVEHDSVLKAVAGASLLPVTSQGIIDLERFEKALQEAREISHDKPIVVAVMLANNETGVIQPIEKVSKIARRYKAKVHCDAVAAFGKVPVDFVALGVDTLTISGNKIGGPKGVGALIVREGLHIPPLISGGAQEKSWRAGTENLSGIAGLAAAIAEMSLAESGRFKALQTRLESKIMAAADPSFPPVIYGTEAERLPTTTTLRMPFVKNETQLIAFDLEGIAVSAGAACSSGTVRGSHVLKAMGIEEDAYNETIRISFGWATTEAEIDQFSEVWIKRYQRALEENRRAA